jgi:hypothetical protein
MSAYDNSSYFRPVEESRKKVGISKNFQPEEIRTGKLEGNRRAAPKDQKAVELRS